MKIVAGLGCIDDYIDLVKAGADEVFCGYVPYEWNKRYGSLFPLNRREVLYYNVQIGTLEDMKILKRMVDKYEVPVTITFNYLYYLEEQYEIIESIIRTLMDIGFNDFIIADIALILYLRERNIDCFIHLSGECSEINRLSMDFLNDLNIGRYIFHRKNTIEDMKSCIENNKVKNLQYEAFMLNERCHFTGGYCNSLHCDELIHLCKMDYDLIKVSEYSNHFPIVDEKLKRYYKNLEDEASRVVNYDEDLDRLGSSGCGICALKNLKEAGVTHLKVVGRGNSIENMKRDVKELKRALSIIDKVKDTMDFKAEVKRNIFQGNCSGKCYY